MKFPTGSLEEAIITAIKKQRAYEETVVWDRNETRVIEFDPARKAVATKAMKRARGLAGIQGLPYAEFAELYSRIEHAMNEFMFEKPNEEKGLHL